MKVPRAQGRVSKPLPALLLALAACAAHSGPPPDRASAAKVPAEPELRVGELAEREIRPGQTHEYKVALQEGQYARLTLEQRRREVEASLYSPSGEMVGLAGPTARWKLELLSFVAPSEGEYQLRLALPAGTADTAAYGLQIEELRKAEPNDAMRIAADRALGDALRERDRHSSGARALVLAKFDEALRLYQEAGDLRGVVDAMTNVAPVHFAAGDLSSAITQLEGALKLAKENGYERGEANALNDLGLVHGRRGETAAARELYLRALALWERLEDTRESGVTLFNLGYLHYNSLGDNESALTYYERARTLLRAGNDLVGEARTLTGTGLIFRRKGDHERAIQDFQAALSLSRQAGDVGVEANAATSLAVIYRWRGELQVALELSVKSLENIRAAGDRNLEASVLQDLGGLYYELGELDKALAAHEEALAIYREAGMPQRQALALLAMGWIHYAMGHPKRALELYASGLEVAEALEDKELEALACQYGGVARVALGEFPEAIDLLARALRLRQASARRVSQATTLLELGTAYGRAGRPELAREHVADALRLAREMEHPSLEAASLMRRAELDRHDGQLLEALAGTEEAITILESVRSRVLSRQLRASFFATRHSYHESRVDLLMELAERQPHDRYEARALQACEQSRARGLLELISEGQVEVQKGVAPDLKRRETDLDRRLSWTQRQLVEALSASSPDTARAQSLREELVKIGEERERLEWEIRQRHAAYAEIRYPSPPTLEVVQRELDDRTAFFEYCLGEDHSYLFVVTRDDLSSYRLAPVSVIDGVVRQMRLALARPDRRLQGQYLQSAVSLFGLLLAPASDILARKPHLLIAPDGALHLVPFEALLREGDFEKTFDQLPYLITTHAMEYIPSAGVLVSLRQASPKGPAAPAKRFVAFADPLGDVAGSLPALPYARREVTEIAKLYSPQDFVLYLQDQAIEENVKRNPLLETARQIHFATHGILDEDQPQLAGLVLGRSRDSTEDGLLQTYEIFNLSLSADLVVLSGCETGLGKQVTGEGLVGITRAFLYAGARSLMVSLWKVADISTPELMVRFYRGLQAGEPEADALRRAKLDLIASRRFAHPSYWSPFVLLGDTRLRAAL